MTTPTYAHLLELLYDAYFECRKKKRNTASAIEFELDYEANLALLARELINGTYQIGQSIAFAITRPRKREVFAANFRDRVVHHLLIREFGGVIDDEMIEDSFSCRVGKGVQHGVERFREQIAEVSDNYKYETYTLSCDISGFFMSIDKGLCYSLIERLLRDKCGVREDLDWWLWLINKVVMNRPELNCIIHGDKAVLDSLPANKTLFKSNGKGFPIGNLTSQIFGNFYLTPFDKWSIAYIGNKGSYCRYVDDIRATSRDKKLLMRYYRDAQVWISEHLGLRLHPNKWSLQDVRKGIPFIGSVVKPWGVYAGKRLVRNAFAAACKKDTPERYVTRMNSYFGFLSHGLTHAIRWQLWNKISEKNPGKYTCFNIKKLKIRQNNPGRVFNIPEKDKKYFIYYDLECYTRSKLQGNRKTR